MTRRSDHLFARSTRLRMTSIRAWMSAIKWTLQWAIWNTPDIRQILVTYHILLHCSQAISSTEWHCISHRWLPQSSCRPHRRPHEYGSSWEHGNVHVSWPPLQAIATGIEHGGHGWQWSSSFGTGTSLGVAGLNPFFGAFTSIHTALWQSAIQRCEQSGIYQTI
jgi:hypothetical protein